MFNRLLLGVSLLGLVGFFFVQEAQAVNCDSNSFSCGNICCPKTQDCLLIPERNYYRCESYNLLCAEENAFICYNPSLDNKVCCPQNAIACGPNLTCLVQGSPVISPSGQGEEGTNDTSTSTGGTRAPNLEGIKTDLRIRDYSK